VVGLSGLARKESKIATIHCLLFCPMDGGSAVTVVDNSTAWGTYFVDMHGLVRS